MNSIIINKTFYYKSIFVPIRCMLTFAEEKLTCGFQFRTAGRQLFGYLGLDDLAPLSSENTKQIAADWFKKALWGSASIYSSPSFYRGDHWGWEGAGDLARTTESSTRPLGLHPPAPPHPGCAFLSLSTLPIHPLSSLLSLFSALWKPSLRAWSISHNAGSPKTP